VMALIGDGLSVSQVAEKVGVRQTRLEGLRDRSHRPIRCPHETQPNSL
jgi:hypothetical protein